MSCSLLFSQQTRLSNYFIENGLAGNQVNCIFQDSAGFMWFGTGEGLSKYDGSKFTNYNTANGLAFNYINDICEIRSNCLLIAENDGHSDLLINGEIDTGKRISNVVVNKIIFSPAANRLFGVTDNQGICQFRNGQWEKVFSLPQPFAQVALVNDSMLALANGFATLPLFSASALTKTGEIQAGNLFITCLYTDRANTTWAGTSTKGLKIIKPGSSPPQPFHIAPASGKINTPLLNNMVIRCMLQDAGGEYWIGTESGLVHIDNGHQQTHYTITQGLPSDDIRCLYQDREKNIWVGTSQGLSKIVQTGRVTFFPTGFRANAREWFHFWKENDTTVFFFTGAGIQSVHAASGKISPWKNSLTTLKGAPLAALKAMPNTGSFERKKCFTTDPVFFNRIPGSPAPGTGPFALDTLNGLYYGISYQWLVYIKSGSMPDTLLQARITTLDYNAEGDLIAGTWNDGLFCIRDRQGKKSVDSLPGILPDKKIRSSFEDREGNFWVGMRHGGLAVFKQGFIDTGSLRIYNSTSGLSSNWVNCMVQDSSGNIWVGTSQGIDKLIPTANGFRIFNFGKVFGLSCSVFDILPAGNNCLWVLTAGGLIRIRDERIDTAQVAPTVITVASIGSANKALSWMQLQQHTSLAYADNSIHFEYAAPSFINEKQILYSYRLLGSNDTVWSRPQNINKVSYASLQNGKYQFQVRAMHWNGDWQAPAVFDFTVLPPFWKTGWFLVLGLVAAGSLIYGLYRNRLLHLRKLQSVKTSIATDLHDEVGSTLTNISVLSMLAKQKIGESNEAAKFIGRIQEEVAASSQALDDIIWSVNEKNDSMEEILLRMRRYAAELFDTSNTGYHLYYDEDLPKMKITMEQRRDIYLIYREAVNNIYKHAMASRVDIHISRTGKGIGMKIRDDGAGIGNLHFPQRNGLKNMGERVKKWNGTMDIQTAAGAGTCLYFSFELY